jgi:hypothetical protein
VTKQLEERLTDFPDYEALPCPIQAETAIAPETPVTDGSFLNAEPVRRPVITRSSRYRAYERYMKIDKGLLGGSTTGLSSTYDVLEQSGSPSHLAAAGWAAIELAMVSADVDTDTRLEHFDQGVACWEKAAQLYDKHQDFGVLQLGNSSDALRLQMNLAIARLSRATIVGEADEALRRQVFLDCLEVAQQNYQQGMSGGDTETETRCEYVGFSVENLVMLGDNQDFESSNYMMQSSLRAGSGSYQREFTHDLVRIYNSGGRIHWATPIEVKATIESKHRTRYRALLIGRRRDLAIEDKPIDYLFEALGAVAVEEADTTQRRVTRELSSRIGQLVAGYEEKPALGSSGNLTIFHRAAKTAVA